MLSAVLSTQMVNFFSTEARSSTSAKEECCMETSGISLSLSFHFHCLFFHYVSRFHGTINNSWERVVCHKPLTHWDFTASICFHNQSFMNSPHTPPCLFPISGKCPRKMNTSVSRPWITEWCRSTVGSWARRGKRTSAFLWASFTDTIVVLL